MTHVEVWREVLRVVAPSVRKGEQPRRIVRFRRCPHSVEIPFLEPEPDEMRCPGCERARLAG